MGTGTLFIVSTPIGNLEDLSSRAARVLGEVEIVLAEDTRRTKGLLTHLGLSVPLLSLHAHNEQERAERVLSALESGESLALVSDAGTPLVSDPGERLLKRVVERGHRVIPVPGPSAVLHALVGSGLPTTPFVFLGFVPRKGKAREEALERAAGSRETAVVFESPERTRALLRDLEARCGPDRRAAIGRELTKVHEEFRRGTLSQLARYYDAEAPRGEITLVLAPVESTDLPFAVDEEAGEALASAILRSGTSPSRAARELARRLGIPRNQAYELVQRVSSRSGAGGPGGSRPRGVFDVDPAPDGERDT